MNKAEEILDRHVSGLSDWTSGFKGDILEAMKEIASDAFDEGQKSALKNSSLVHKDFASGIRRDVREMLKAKQQYLDKVFNNE